MSERTEDQDIDEQGEQSFPASDPPSQPGPESNPGRDTDLPEGGDTDLPSGEPGTDRDEETSGERP